MGMKKAKFRKQFKIEAIRIYLGGEHGGYREDGRGKNSSGQFILPPKIENLPIT